MQIVEERLIQASPQHIFDTVADIRNLSKALPHVIAYTFLTEKKQGVDVRFREVREMKGRQATTEIEITEYIPHERVRMVARSGGTTWDSLFLIEGQEKGTRLQLIMEARAHHIFARIMNHLIKGMVSRAVANDWDLIKAYCERTA